MNLQAIMKQAQAMQKDITKAKKVFKEYIKKYDPTNGKIAIKIAHMYRVAEIAKKA